MVKTTFFTLLSLIFMIFHADLVTKGAAAGLLLWYTAVVPALFPFMVLSSVLSASGGISWLMRPFTVLFRFCGLSSDGWYVLLTGLLCGCPMGAKTCADFIEQDRIRLGEAKFLFALCNHPSPMFLAGFVYPMFAAQMPLSYFVLAIYAPLLLLAVPAHLIYCAPFRPKPRQENFGILGQRPTRNFINTFSSKSTISDNSSNSALSLDAAILNSAEILVKIGGYLIFYSILILVIRNTPAIPAPVRLFFSGTLEITTGIRAVSDSLTYPYSAITAAAIFSFGGFSAMSQTNAVIQMHKSPSESVSTAVSCRTPQSLTHKKTAGLSIRQYLLWKIAHTSLTAAVMAVLTGALRFSMF